MTVRLGAGAVIGVLVLAACSNQTEDAVSPTAGAIEACLTAGAEHLSFPVEGSGDVSVSTARDDKGWWDVRATVRGMDGAEITLQCTAVPDDGPLGARAASFGIETTAS